MSITPKCRLHLVFARDAPIAAIFRRGPTRRFHIIRWHYQQNLFEHGSWFKGMIYVEVSALSPDGRWLYYFAANHSMRTQARLGAGTWAAIGLLPWLKAHWIEPHGDTYCSRLKFVTPDDAEYASGTIIDALPPQFRLAADSPYLPAELVEDADWTGRDLWNRIVFSRGGQLFRQTAWGEDELIADYTSLQPPERGSVLKPT